MSTKPLVRIVLVLVSYFKANVIIHGRSFFSDFDVQIHIYLKSSDIHLWTN